MKNIKKRTTSTVNIDNEIFDAVKSYCKERDLYLKAFIQSTILEKIKKQQSNGWIDGNQI